MSKTTTAAEYRKCLEDKRRARKDIKLPSGHTFEIRKVSLLTFSKIFKGKMNLLDEIAEQQNDEVKLLELLRTKEVAEMFSEAITKPKIVVGEAQDEEELSAKDIDDMDLIVLFNSIIIFNDLDKYTAEKLGFFREESTGPSGGPTG